jgi:DNA excision repair protein ERCC-3
MVRNPDNPLTVQSDRTLLLEVEHPRYVEARNLLARFAELEKSPEFVHTYRITPLSVWNALAAGMTAGGILESLEALSRYDVPPSIATEIRGWTERYGKIRLERRDERLVLCSEDPLLLREIWSSSYARSLLGERLDETAIFVDDLHRGRLKQALIKLGYPVRDLAGYVEGAPLEFALRENTRQGEPFHVRHYQREAAEIFHAGGAVTGGSGVVVLPCGAGKTIVGLAVMAKLRTHTLILCTNTTAVRQWIREILDKTTLSEEEVGEYTGKAKEIRPVTVSDYQILTYRRRKVDPFLHFDLVSGNDWGLILYDEVHLLPAPVFRVTAEIQARRRLGLTATLVREDGKEEDVFTLVGPKKYDVPWKVLEEQGWIAAASCIEVRVPLEDAMRGRYAVADGREKFRIASENDRKTEMVRRILERHRDDRVLIIGQYLDQLRRIAATFDAPLITGKTAQSTREQLYGKFRNGAITLLAVSKVGNFSVDLPDANVAIQVSGTFGSRQEEAQRLGRILRPKKQGTQALFYSLVTRDTRDQEFASKRQLFLTEQGYTYEIRDDRLFEGRPAGRWDPCT